MPQEVTYYCAFCNRRETVSAPTTFTTLHEGDVEDAACPEHADAMAFLEDQCPSCVSGWGECDMFMAIGSGAVTADHLASIRGGLCPFRVNGTFMVSPDGFRPDNISIRSSAGEAFAQACLAYTE